MKILVVIPTYNEKEMIGSLLDRVFGSAPVDVLVVDDNSPDGTGMLLDSIAANEPRLNILHRPGKLGLGSAYRDGFQWALEHEYERIIQMDGDGSHDPQYIPKFLELSEQYDVVIGSRYIHGGGTDVSWSLFRKFLSRAGNAYTNAILFLKNRRYRIQDSTGGFKCWRADMLRKIDMQTIRSDGYAFQIEMNWLAVQHGARVIEAPIIFHDRLKGKSKIARSGIFQTALLPFRLGK